jgi:precorrin-2 dehydrogenase / sirohydrochlorin ferrochelatase
MGEYLPLYIDLSCKRVVIFGGGAVGERKAKYFAPAGVVVVSSRFTECLEAMGAEGILKLERRDVNAQDVPRLIEDAFLVVAATGDKKLNDKISSLAEARGILVNNATGETAVVIPSVIKKGDVTVAISTGGRSPAMSKFIRLKLEASISPDVEKMVELQEKVREQIKKSVKSQKSREEILWAVLDDPAVWKALEKSPARALELAMRHARQ